MANKAKQKTRGGSRPGSGRKPIIDNPKVSRVYVGQKTIHFLSSLGAENGKPNFSQGVRDAEQIVRSLAGAIQNGKISEKDLQPIADKLKSAGLL